MVVERRPRSLHDRVNFIGIVVATYAAIGVAGYLSLSSTGGWSRNLDNGHLMRYSGRPPVEGWISPKQEVLAIQQPALNGSLDMSRVTRKHNSLYVDATNARSLDEITAHIQKVCGEASIVEPLQEEDYFGVPRLRTKLLVNNGSCIATQPS